MLIAVLSDVHANLDALEAVLARAEQLGVESTYVLGDIVGYGAEPEAVISRLRALPNVVLIAGNHDLAAVGRFDSRWFNSMARAAIEWTGEQMSDESRALLESLEPRARLKSLEPRAQLKSLETRGDADDALLVHGSVVDPAAEYLTDERRAATSFDHERFELGFFGHTHLPTLFIEENHEVRGTVLPDGEKVPLARPCRYLVNPGSVGQPRDGDPRAAFLVFDTDARAVTLQRVDYAIDQAQKKITAAGLPAFLADRLAVGR